MRRKNISADIMALHDEVTGSCIFISAKDPDKDKSVHFVVDCGLYQEPAYVERNGQKFPFNPEEVNFVLLTHNHIDHIGATPLLCKQGFGGKFHSTNDTKTLMPYALADTFSILSQRAKRAGTVAIYSETNVSSVIHQLQGHSYEETFSPAEGIKVTFFKNGHLVGASMILVQIESYGCDSVNLLFTGDYNNKNSFFDVPKLPKWVQKLPLTVVTESTYGTMDSNEIVPALEKNLIEFFNAKPDGTVVLPVFSLGRSQEVLKFLRRMQDEEKLSKEIPVYLDGKLTLQYTSLYTENRLESIDLDKNLFIPENCTFVNKDLRPFILKDDDPKIIVSSSGMGSYGPAQSYIQSYIRRSDAMIHFTGYCAEGTISRTLFDAPEDSIIEFAGLAIKKRAWVRFTNELTAHAKADEFIDFFRQFTNLQLVLVNHGQTEVKKIFSERVVDEVDPKDVGILSRDYYFRVSAYGLIKTMTSKLF